MGLHCCIHKCKGSRVCDSVVIGSKSDGRRATPWLGCEAENVGHSPKVG
jgi:hypothetical protein